LAYFKEELGQVGRKELRNFWGIRIKEGRLRSWEGRNFQELLGLLLLELNLTF